jgi:hypothetical protein
MDILHILLIISTILGIIISILQILGKTKLARILKIVAQGIDAAKPMLKDEFKGPGSKANTTLTEFIATSAETNGLLKDLDGFLKVNGLNKKTE